MKYPFVFLFILTLLSYQNQIISKDEMSKIVKTGNDRLGYLFKKGDADSLALMYTSEGKLSLNGYDFIQGRLAIQQLWKDDMINSHVLEMNTQTITVDGTKEVIYETGKTFLKLSFKDSVFTTTVKYCNIWCLQKDGTYKLDVDFSNSDK